MELRKVTFIAGVHPDQGVSLQVYGEGVEPQLEQPGFGSQPVLDSALEGAGILHTAWESVDAYPHVVKHLRHPRNPKVDYKFAEAVATRDQLKTMGFYREGVRITKSEEKVG